MATRWSTYVDEVLAARHWDTKMAAEKTGIDKSAFSRWQRLAPSPAHVVKFARGARANVLDALVAADLITVSEAGLREVPVGLDQLSDLELVEELRDRLVAQEWADRGSPGYEPDFETERALDGQSLTPLADQVDHEPELLLGEQRVVDNGRR